MVTTNATCVVTRPMITASKTAGTRTPYAISRGVAANLRADSSGYALRIDFSLSRCAVSSLPSMFPQCLCRWANGGRGCESDVSH